MQNLQLFGHGTLAVQVSVVVVVVIVVMRAVQVSVGFRNKL